jgi:hypothetical protein
MTENGIWAEELPDNCPPTDAIQPNNMPFYRLVGNIPPEERDFWSHRKLYPNKDFGLSECVIRACSVISNLDQCRILLKLPTQQGKLIVEITLPPESGLIKKTRKNQYHYSWWRKKDFDPIPICVEIK